MSEYLHKKSTLYCLLCNKLTPCWHNPQSASFQTNFLSIQKIPSYMMVNYQFCVILSDHDSHARVADSRLTP